MEEAIEFDSGSGAGINQTLVREFHGIPVATSLTIEMDHQDANKPGTVAAIEVIEEP